MASTRIVDADTHREQAARTLKFLADWLQAAPGRTLVVAFTLEDGWRANMREDHIARGESLSDCLAQCATAVAFEVTP